MSPAGNPYPVPLDPNVPICLSGKRGFLTEDDANKKLRLVRSIRRGERAGKKIESRAYRCDICRCWHLTAKKRGG